MCDEFLSSALSLLSPLSLLLVLLSFSFRVKTRCFYCRGGVRWKLCLRSFSTVSSSCSINREGRIPLLNCFKSTKGVAEERGKVHFGVFRVFQICVSTNAPHPQSQSQQRSTSPTPNVAPPSKAVVPRRAAATDAGGEKEVLFCCC